MADQKIEETEGIGPAYGEKLRAASIPNTDELLVRGGTKAGRKQIAEQTGISESSILKWVNMADLFRIKGVGSEYAELLEGAGVDTVKELATRNAENLTAKMEEVNAAKKLARRTPAASSVAKWVEQAKTLPPMVTY